MPTDFQPISITVDSSGNFLGGLYQNGVPVITGLHSGSNISLVNNNDGTYTISAITSPFSGGANITGFKSSLNSGQDMFWISYPITLPSNPTSLACTMESTNPLCTFGFMLSGISSSGHFLHLSNSTPNASYSLDTIVLSF